MLELLSRLQTGPAAATAMPALDAVSSLLRGREFGRLLAVHNAVQATVCFRCPPVALCCDSRNLVQEVLLLML